MKGLDMAGSSEEPQQENLRVRGKVAVDAPEVAARVPRCRQPGELRRVAIVEDAQRA